MLRIQADDNLFCRVKFSPETTSIPEPSTSDVVLLLRPGRHLLSDLLPYLRSPAFPKTHLHVGLPRDPYSG